MPIPLRKRFVAFTAAILKRANGNPERRADLAFASPFLQHANKTIDFPVIRLSGIAAAKQCSAHDSLAECAKHYLAFLQTGLQLPTTERSGVRFDLRRTTAFGSVEKLEDQEGNGARVRASACFCVTKHRGKLDG
jgi:hypothetical protein